ncbi:IS5 family transposase [Pseudonocardia hispaniensis]|uniref:IS5 family transposase n=1 Tax=Pseudonocardia hispaniensis TaxID=904933 RepID=A0ABW1J1L8_9PSEU
MVLDRHDLTDAEWARVEPLLPDTTSRRGGRWADHRTVLNAVFWRTRCGAPWRDLPKSYGSWKTIYNRHRRWSADGTWERVLDELRRNADHTEGPDWTVAVDGALVRAHQHAAGARHRPPAELPQEDSTLQQPCKFPTSRLATTAAQAGSPARIGVAGRPVQRMRTRQAPHQSTAI